MAKAAPIHGGIWKTAVLAIAITLAGGLIIMRSDQDSGPAKILPQLVSGPRDDATKYRSIVQVVNVGTAAARVTGRFYNADGSISNATYNTMQNGASAALNNGTFSANLAPKGLLTIAGVSGPDTVVNWAMITSSGKIAISGVLEIADAATNVVRSRAAMEASDTDMREFVIPAAGSDVGFAIVNAGGDSASLTASLYDANGGVVQTKELQLGGHVQKAGFMRELFADAPVAKGVVRFTSPRPQFAAWALAHEGDSVANVPVVRLR